MKNRTYKKSFTILARTMEIKEFPRIKNEPQLDKNHVTTMRSHKSLTGKSMRKLIRNPIIRQWLEMPEIFWTVNDRKIETYDFKETIKISDKKKYILVAYEMTPGKFCIEPKEI